MVKTWQDLGVLIVGCGSIGKRHARVLHGMGVRDLRACDTLAAQRDSLRAAVPAVRMHDSYSDGLLERPDAVLICTPPSLHIPQARQAILAGCHALIEKPLSDTTAGVDELEALAAAEGRKVMVAHCMRYHAGLCLAKDALDRGAIGRLVSVRALIGEHLPDVRPDYRSLFSARQGGAFDLMHEIDLALWYAGLPVTRVLSLSGTYSDIGIVAPDVAEIIVGFEGRCLASVHLDFFQRPRRRQIELMATEGVITVEYASWDQCTVSTFEAATGAWTHRNLATERDDMFRAEDREFLEAVAGDKPIRCTIREARKAVEVVLTASQPPGEGRRQPREDRA